MDTEFFVPVMDWRPAQGVPCLEMGTSTLHYPNGISMCERWVDGRIEGNLCKQNCPSNKDDS